MNSLMPKCSAPQKRTPFVALQGFVVSEGSPPTMKIIRSVILSTARGLT